MPKNVAPETTLEAFTTQAFASTFTPDISNAATVKVTLTGLMSQVNAPTGRSFGIYTLCFVQNGTGGNFVGWNTTDYPDFAVGNWNPNLAANSVSSISFYYDSNSSKWRPFSAFNGDLWAFRSSGTANSSNVIRVGNQNIGADASGVTVSGLTASGLISAATTIQTGTLRGGTGSGGNLQLSSTSNATKGKITFGTSAYDEVNNRLGIGNTTPGQALDVTGQGVFSSTVTHAEPTASTHSATKNYVDTAGSATHKIISGAWYNTVSVYTVSAAAPASGTMHLVPFYPDKAGTINGVSWEVTTQGVGVASTDDLRLGLYAASTSNGRPTGAALFDSGLQNLEVATGVKTLSVSWTGLTSQLYYLAVVRQVTGTPTTAAQLRLGTLAGTSVHIGDSSATPTIGAAGGPSCAFTQTGVTGALPTIGTLVQSTNVTATPIVLFKYS